MTTEHDLPPLPEPIGLGLLRYPYDEDDMRSYALAAVDKQWEHFGELIDSLGAYAASINGKPRSERQDGWNDCVTELIRRFEAIDAARKGEHHG